MRDFIGVNITLTPSGEDLADFLAAWLGDIGYDSFTYSDGTLHAYINHDDFDAEQLREAIDSFPAPGCRLEYTIDQIPGCDWNAEWERNYFKPIMIDDRCVVYSSFHTDVPDAEYRIVVDPKMAFGTGHHATTHLMLDYLLNHNISGMSVIDMGTGTGILAIMALMRGAAHVAGVEIDPDAFTNAQENVRLNDVAPQLICGDASRLPELNEADLFLANINRNIITADMHQYVTRIRCGGRLVCSGFYQEDIAVVEQCAAQYDLHILSQQVMDRWARVEFVKGVKQD